jgi:hypothetical protein
MIFMEPTCARGSNLTLGIHAFAVIASEAKQSTGEQCHDAGGGLLRRAARFSQ